MITSLISLYLASLLNNVPHISAQQVQASMFSESLRAYPVPTRAPASADTVPASDASSPDIQANAYLTMDIRSGKILSEKNTKTKRSIGSITKLMTALIILDENNINTIVKVSPAATAVEGSRIWLAPGEKITIKDLLYGLLIHSGNDAAYALAIHNAGSVEGFVSKMNDKAKKLGLVDTHFGNPAGLDRDENYSTAHDVAIMGTYAYRNNLIRYITGISKITISSVNGQFKHELKSTNELLDKDPRFKGLKTGYTLEAGHSFVGVALAPNGSPLLTVVLDSPDRFKETVSLINWATANYNW